MASGFVLSSLSYLGHGLEESVIPWDFFEKSKPPI